MTEQEKKRLIWVVTPAHTSEYDEWWGAAETEEDHQAALEYASDRLEALWDSLDVENEVVGVTIERRWVTETEWKESQGE